MADGKENGDGPRPEKHVYDHKRRVTLTEMQSEGITQREKELLDIIADMEDVLGKIVKK